MILAGIKELKDKLSRYLSLVKQGEEVLITKRGRTVARIVPESPENTWIREALRPLIVKGLVTLPSRKINKAPSLPVEVPGKPISEMVIEDRR